MSNILRLSSAAILTQGTANSPLDENVQYHSKFIHSSSEGCPLIVENKISLQANPHVPAAVMAPATSPPGLWAWAPVKSPSRQGLAASLSRRGRPAWSCVRHGSRLLLLPCPPAALLPPPPPARRNLRPVAFPPRLPALPASPAPAPVGERRVGEGRNAPPSASGAGEPGNRRRHLPTSPSAGGARKPPARRGHCPGVPRPAPPEAPLAWRIST